MVSWLVVRVSKGFVNGEWSLVRVREFGNWESGKVETRKQETRNRLVG